MNKFVLSCLSIALLSSCANQSYKIHKEGYSYKETETQSFFFWGLGQEEFIDAKKVCGPDSKVTRVDTHENFGAAFVGWITSGIYAPRNVTVFCSK